MNKSYAISLKEFKPFPRFNSKTAASTKIFLLVFLGGLTIINLGVNWGNDYVPATARGNYEDLKRVPFIPTPYNFNIEGI